MDTKPDADRIRALNDAARRNPGSGACSVFFTSGIDELRLPEQAIIMTRVIAFDDFTEDNDPWGEHDFGSFEHSGTTIFWKIDYYDLHMQKLSPDPSDPVVTHRVLTVMLADEY